MAAPDFGQQALAAAAGVDPWALARKVTTSDPEMLRATGAGFAAQARAALEAARAGAAADRAAAAAYTNGGAPVYDAEGAARAARSLLSDDGAGLTATGTVFSTLAADLTDARTGAGRVLTALTADVNDVVERRNRFVASSGLTEVDAEAADRGFLVEAAGLLKGAGARVQGVLDVYDGQVRRHTATLAALPQARPVPLAAAPPPAAPGALQQAGALAGEVVDTGVSLLNAIAHNPGLVLALAGGVGLVALGATGELAGLAADATVVGLPGGLSLGVVATAGVITGSAGVLAAGGLLMDAAHGEDKVAGVIGNPFGDVMTAPTMTDSNGQTWDRNDQWEKVTGAIPGGSRIAHDGSSRVHIPYGSELPDGSWSGGHWNQAAVPRKTVFPPDWTPERILEETLDVARNPDQAPTQDPDDGRWTLYGTSGDGVEIKVVLKPDGTILTGHPIRGPGVEVTDENGDPHPMDGN